MSHFLVVDRIKYQYNPNITLSLSEHVTVMKNEEKIMFLKLISQNDEIVSKVDLEIIQVDENEEKIKKGYYTFKEIRQSDKKQHILSEGFVIDDKCKKVIITVLDYESMIIDEMIDETYSEKIKEKKLEQMNMFLRTKDKTPYVTATFFILSVVAIIITYLLWIQ